MKILQKIFKRKEDEKMNFEKLSDEWLEYKKITIKESTYLNYMNIIEKYLKPEFKELNFDEVINYNNYIQKLLNKLSHKTVRDIIAVLKAILKYYEEEYNKVLKIKRSGIPKLIKKKIQILNEKETLKLEEYCLSNSTLKNLGILICINTGIRIGEICALKWENIDLEERKIRIIHTVERLYNKKCRNSKVVINTPKTESSIRSIPISDKLFQSLKIISKDYKNDAFFLSGTNKLVEPRSYQYYFKDVLNKLNIKPYKFHSLRHTFATNCIKVGMDIKSLSEILGHADINITLKIYVHSSDKLKKKYLEKL